jgi:hypothetical protein
VQAAAAAAAAACGQQQQQQQQQVDSTTRTAAAAAAEAHNEALVERHAVSIGKAKRLIDKKISVLQAQTRGASGDGLMRSTGMVLRDGNETWTGGRVTGYLKSQKQYSVRWDGDDASVFTTHSFEEMCSMARFVVRWEMKSVRRSSKRARGQVGMERFESQECIVRVALQASEVARREGRGS